MASRLAWAVAFGAPRFFYKYVRNKQKFGDRIRYTFRPKPSLTSSDALNKIQAQLSPISASVLCDYHWKTERHSVKMSEPLVLSNNQVHSNQEACDRINAASHRNYSSMDSGQPRDRDRAVPLKLMDGDARIWPSPFKSLKNMFFTLLIRGYFDEDYSAASFLRGTKRVTFNTSILIPKL